MIGLTLLVISGKLYGSTDAKTQRRAVVLERIGTWCLLIGFGLSLLFWFGLSWSQGQMDGATAGLEYCTASVMEQNFPDMCADWERDHALHEHMAGWFETALISAAIL